MNNNKHSSFMIYLQSFFVTSISTPCNNKNKVVVPKVLLWLHLRFFLVVPPPDKNYIWETGLSWLDRHHPSRLFHKLTCCRGDILSQRHAHFHVLFTMTQEQFLSKMFVKADFMARLRWLDFIHLWQ